MAANQEQNSLTAFSDAGILNIENGRVSVILPRRTTPMVLNVPCDDPELLAAIWRAIGDHFDHNPNTESALFVGAFEYVVEMCKNIPCTTEAEGCYFKSSEQLLEWLACRNSIGRYQLIKQARKALDALRASQTRVKSAYKR